MLVTMMMLLMMMLVAMMTVVMMAPLMMLVVMMQAHRASRWWEEGHAAGRGRVWPTPQQGRRAEAGRRRRPTYHQARQAGGSSVRQLPACLQR